MVASWPSTVRVISMLSSATVAIRISNPTAIPKIFKPHSARSLSLSVTRLDSGTGWPAALLT